MFNRLSLAWSAAAILTIAVALWPVQVVTVTLPKEGNRTLAIIRTHTGGVILFSYRHSVELIRVEGRFEVTPESELVAVDTRMESVGTGLPNSHPDRTISENGWLVVDEHRKPVGPLRFFLVPMNQVRLSIDNHQVDLSGLESGTLIRVSAEKMRWMEWFVSIIRQQVLNRH